MSTVAKKVMMGSGAVAGDFEIEQSLILDDVGNAHLKRTPGSAGNRRTFTLSCWIKRATENAISAIFAQDLNFLFESGSDERALKLGYYTAAGHQIRLATTAVFRDMSAWYHIVLAVDTTQSTASNRVKMYINGVQQTSFQSGQNTYPSQNLELPVNNTTDVFYLGALNATAYSIGYLAETHFIDGAAKAASDFGETNSDTGQWIPKEYTGGSYGTNGFYLKFASGAIGTDSSGEGNDLTAVNTANSDVVIDTPLNNFATLNPAVSATSGMVLSEGNLHGVFRSASITNGQQAVSTIDMPAGSGKWYWEMRQTYTGLGFIMGIVPKGELPRMSYAGSLGYGYVNAGGVKNINATESSYGTAWFTSGQTYIISCYYDSDNRKVGFKLNNTDQGYVSEDVTAGSYAAAFSNASGGSGSQPTDINFGQNGTFNGAVTAQGNADTNGIGDFYYAPPSGFKALCTANLPAPAIPLPSAQFNTVLYTGDGSTNHDISGVGFQPDFVWIKNRSQADSHVLNDAVRGAGKTLYSDLNYAEANNEAYFGPFQTDGFRLSPTTVGDAFNASSENYVSWNWKANGAGSTNNDGNQASSVSANQAAGFSIASFTGTGSWTTYGHGLGVIPEVVITKSRSASGDWYFVHNVVDGSLDYLVLNTTAANSNASGTLPSSSIFYSSYSNNQTVVAYCFASKPGFSKIGIYTGNGNASGPFISTGFKPAWVMIKRTDSAAEWVMFDNKRSPFNVVDKVLLAENSVSEYTIANMLDINSNGFKMRDTHSSRNANNGVYLYMAFAESPFKTANAR